MMDIKEECASAYIPKITDLAAGMVNDEATEFLLMDDMKLVASQKIYDMDFLQNLLTGSDTAAAEHI